MEFTEVNNFPIHGFKVWWVIHCDDRTRQRVVAVTYIVNGFIWYLNENIDSK